MSNRNSRSPNFHVASILPRSDSGSLFSPPTRRQSSIDSAEIDFFITNSNGFRCYWESFITYSTSPKFKKMAFVLEQNSSLLDECRSSLTETPLAEENLEIDFLINENAALHLAQVEDARKNAKIFTRLKNDVEQLKGEISMLRKATKSCEENIKDSAVPGYTEALYADGLEIVRLLQNTKYKDVKQTSLDLTYRYVKEDCYFPKMFLLIEDDLITSLTPHIKTREPPRSVLKSLARSNDLEFRNGLPEKALVSYDLLIKICLFDKKHTIERCVKKSRQNSFDPKEKCPNSPYSNSINFRKPEIDVMRIRPHSRGGEDSTHARPSFSPVIAEDPIGKHSVVVTPIDVNPGGLVTVMRFANCYIVAGVYSARDDEPGTMRLIDVEALKVIKTVVMKGVVENIAVVDHVVVILFTTKNIQIVSLKDDSDVSMDKSCIVGNILQVFSYPKAIGILYKDGVVAIWEVIKGVLTPVNISKPLMKNPSFAVVNMADVWVIGKEFLGVMTCKTQKSFSKLKPLKLKGYSYQNITDMVVTYDHLILLQPSIIDIIDKNTQSVTSIVIENCSFLTDCGAVVAVGTKYSLTNHFKICDSALVSGVLVEERSHEFILLISAANNKLYRVDTLFTEHTYITNTVESICYYCGKIIKPQKRLFMSKMYIILSY
ncbi:hypothetical protein QTN25_001757 [Entamoeba marina]